MSKRNLFNELSQGLAEAREHDQGKLTLRTVEVEFKPLQITPAEIVRIRKSLGMSQGVFSALLRANERTYEKWEQGESRPNKQAIALIKLVKQNPDLLQIIAAL